MLSHSPSFSFYFTLIQAKNSEMLIECFYNLEDFVALGRLMDALPEGSPLLLNVGEKFQSVGLCQEGVAAFMKVRACRGCRAGLVFGIGILI